VGEHCGCGEVLRDDEGCSCQFLFELSVQILNMKTYMRIDIPRFEGSGGLEILELEKDSASTV
jgi:hypothetical protein